MNPPLIGITASIRVDSQTGNAYYSAYAPNITAIEKAGGLPVLIPCGLREDTLRSLYERVDAVLLPGGGDIDPAYYGEARHPLTNNIIPERDQTEIAIARWAVNEDVPLFGICRGHQVLNVALGGTLIQDIPSEIKTALKHDTPRDVSRSTRSHTITAAAGSRLAEVLGSSPILVNSLHHQSVERPAPALRVTALAPDGVIEAAEVPGNRFAMSVQWHPEDLTDDQAMLHLFTAFVDAARQTAAIKGHGS